MCTNGTIGNEFYHDLGVNGTIGDEFFHNLGTEGTIDREFFHDLGTNGMSDYVLRGDTGATENPGPGPECAEQVFVMSVDTVFHSLSSGSPGLVLDTGATESAIGVQTLHDMLQATRISYTVSTAERPVFRFGDGLSLRASSKVVLHGTSLGSVSFFVLDGDHRPQTWNASKTPALIGSKYLRESKATISYEHMRLWFLDPANQLWGTELLQTQSGHLMIPVDSDFMNLTQLRRQAEETYSIVLPPDAQSLIDVLSTPGAALELQRIQTGGAKSSSEQREPQQSAPGHVKEQEPESSVFVGTASQCQHGFHEDSPVRPPMAQRLQSLRMQLGCLALRRSAGPQQHVQFEDGRPFGRTSGQGLAVRGQAQSERPAPEPVGHVERTRGVRPSPHLREEEDGARLHQDRGAPGTPRGNGHGGTPLHDPGRGPDREHCQGQDHGDPEAQEGDGREGQDRDADGRARAITKAPDLRRPPPNSLPTTATSSQDVVAMSRAKAAPRKREPRPTLGNPVAKTESEKEKDLEEAWLLLQDQEFKLSALKMKLEEEMRANGKAPTRSSRR